MTINEISELLVGKTIAKLELARMNDGDGVKERIEIWGIETADGYVIQIAPYYERDGFAPPMIDIIYDKNEVIVHGPTRTK